VNHEEKIGIALSTSTKIGSFYRRERNRREDCNAKLAGGDYVEATFPYPVAL
jgi:hypothetical protein